MTTHTVPEWLTDDRVGTIVSPAEAAELPIGALVARSSIEVYRVGPIGGMRLPLTNDPASRRINMFGLALDAALKVVSVPGLRVDRRCLDALPEGAVVTNRDGDLWSAVEVDGARGWVCTFDREGNRRVGTPSTAYSSAALLAAYGPVVGSGFVPGFYPAPTVVGGLYTTPTEDADADRFDDQAEDADNSLDLDDLYRAPVGTVVVDKEGDLWVAVGVRPPRWALVRSGDDATPPDSYEVVFQSSTLLDLYGPVAYASAEDVMAACDAPFRPIVDDDTARADSDRFDDQAEDADNSLDLDPDMSCWSDRAPVGTVVVATEPDPEPEHALNEYDADLDPDAVVEYALNRARVALTGEGEHVVVSITRDSDGRVSARTEVTEKVGE